MKPRNDMNCTLCHFLLKLLDLFFKMLIASGEVQRKRARLGSNAEVVSVSEYAMNRFGWQSAC